MAATAEEKQARDVTKQVNTDLYGMHPQGSLDRGLNWYELYNRYMILRVLAHTSVDIWFTAAEKAKLEGRLIIKS